jgi:hypothetical protein
MVAERIKPFSRHSMVPRFASWHMPTSSPLTIKSLSVALYPSRSAKDRFSAAMTCPVKSIINTRSE